MYKRQVVQGQALYNHNKLLSLYEGCIGVKTGYTMAAGRTLVSCAERGDTRFICVTLCDRDDWDDHAALYDWAFANYEYVRVADAQTLYRVNAVGGDGPYAAARVESDVYALLPVGAEWDISLELPPFVICPVESGQEAGRLTVTSGGEEICSVPLVYAADMPASGDSTGFFSGAKRFFANLGRPLYFSGG